MSTKSSSRFTPVIIAISVVIGILIGTFYAKHFAGNRLGIINGSSNKLNALLRIVDDQYVDTVNMTDLVEKAMPQILAELDPHSTYIPAQNLEEVNSELEGSFSGIGIQFTIQNDTIHVNAVIQPDVFPLYMNFIPESVPTTKSSISLIDPCGLPNITVK